MIRISVCMIVKNEALVLERILRQIKKFADEIIVADTGSSDETKEIAARYTNQIFDYPWKEDFAAARNYVCEKASMDYWMWLDADDVLPEKSIEELKELKQTLSSDVDVVMMKYVTGFDEKGKESFSYYRERLLKNQAGFTWEGRVHEAVTPKGNILYLPIEIEHRKIGKGDVNRNLHIYENMLRNGERLNPRNQFYYGRELYYHGRYEEAIAVFQEFILQSDGWKENKIEACLQMAFCYEMQKNTQARLESLFVSFLFGQPRANLCCEIGRCFMEKEEFETAVYWYERALEAPKAENTGGFIQKDYEEYLPCIQLCVCHDRLQNYDEAWKYHKRAKKVKPDAETVKSNETYFRNRFGK